MQHTKLLRFYFLVPFLTLALFVTATMPASVSASDDPQQLVVDTTDKRLAKLKEKKSELDKNPALVYGMVRNIVLPHFDFIRMSRWSLGKNWRKADKKQKIRFIKAFRELMIRTYAVALLEYTNQKISYLPLRDDVSKGDVTVRTAIIQPDGKKVAIHYSLYNRPNKGWKVYDISVEGISLISNYRTSFAMDVKKIGLDALIERLEKHNVKKSGKS